MISSTFAEGGLEADGRRYVTETHTLDDGTTATFSWLGSQDAQAVVDARAAELQRQYDAKQAAIAMIVGTKLPLTPLEFLRRIPAAKRIAIRAAAATDPIIADFLDLMNRAQFVAVTDQDTVAAVGYLQALGLLDAAEAAEVLA